MCDDCFSLSGASLRILFALGRVHVQAMDRQLNVGPRYSTVVQVGDSTAIPPVAECSASVTEGMAPLDVTIDMSLSYDVDGSLAPSSGDVYGGE